MLSTIDTLLAQPIVGVVVGSLIGFAGTAIGIWAQARQARKAAVIKWRQDYVTQIQATLEQFDLPAWGVVNQKVDPTEPVIREYERAASSYFKFGVLLSPSVRASLEGYRLLARTASLILKARNEDSEQMEKLALELPGLDGLDLKVLEGKPSGELLMYLSRFPVEYRSALLYVHDASLAKLQKLAGIR